MKARAESHLEGRIDMFTKRIHGDLLENLKKRIASLEAKLAGKINHFKTSTSQKSDEAVRARVQRLEKQLPDVLMKLVDPIVTKKTNAADAKIRAHVNQMVGKITARDKDFIGVTGQAIERGQEQSKGWQGGLLAVVVVLLLVIYAAYSKWQSHKKKMHMF